MHAFDLIPYDFVRSFVCASADMDRVHQIIGFCPQFDTLWGNLTPHETLLFYARLKGVPDELQTEHVVCFLRSFTSVFFSWNVLPAFYVDPCRLSSRFLMCFLFAFVCLFLNEVNL